MQLEKELTKLYYSIGEVAELLDVSNSLIRYWESEFPQLKPQKNRKGDRRYTTKDIHILVDIYNLVKERGFTLDGARKELTAAKRRPKKDTTALKNRLENVLERLQKLSDRLG